LLFGCFPGGLSNVLKFLNGFLNAPARNADSRHDLAHTYSQCQARIAALEAELERMSRPFLGYLDEGARDRSQAEEALAALDLMDTKRELRAEITRFDELRSRLETTGGSVARL
jgi:hypothetical protein